MPHLPDFLARHPGIEFSFSVTEPTLALGPDENADLSILLAGERPLDGDFIARPLLRSLVGTLNEAASLGILDNNEVVYVERVQAGLIRLGANQKPAIIKMVLHEIEKKGLVESMMVLFGGVDRDVRGVVDVMVDHTLPAYLESKQHELRDLFQIYVEQKLAHIQLADLGLHEQVFDLANIRQILQQRVLNNPQLADLVQHLAAQVLEAIFSQLALQVVVLGDEGVHRFEHGGLLSAEGRPGNDEAPARSAQGRADGR